jgi:hypothetical protein
MYLYLFTLVPRVIDFDLGGNRLLDLCYDPVPCFLTALDLIRAID